MIWFEEMVDTLRSKWRRGIPFEAMIGLSDDLDRMLQQIRSERQIRSPLFKCPECGQVGEGTPPQVSVRAMILSVIRFNIDDAEPTRAVEKAWKAYQKGNHLDVYGKRPTNQPSELLYACCYTQVIVLSGRTDFLFVFDLGACVPFDGRTRSRDLLRLRTYFQGPGVGTTALQSVTDRADSSLCVSYGCCQREHTAFVILPAICLNLLRWHALTVTPLISGHWAQNLQNGPLV